MTTPTDTCPLTLLLCRMAWLCLQKTVVQIWLYDHADLRIEGRIVGFDEFMNVVLEEACEVSTKKGTRTALGRIMLKGDNITLVHPAPVVAAK